MSGWGRKTQLGAHQRRVHFYAPLWAGPHYRLNLKILDLDGFISTCVFFLRVYMFTPTHLVPTRTRRGNLVLELEGWVIVSHRVSDARMWFGLVWFEAGSP